jgi:hypothetical protein
MKAFPIIILFNMFFATLEAQSKLYGAYQNINDDVTTIRIYTNEIFSVAVFKKNEFVSTYGGKYKLDGNELTEVIEFDTQKPEQVGKELKKTLKWKKNDWTFDGEIVPFKSLDNGGPGKLAGAWLITGRFSENEMNKITPGARRTMKILSGTRFQWIAYNVETKEFFGTGGGAYKTENGKYIENIDFFSRDNSRVGASLEFNFVMQPDGTWRHSGKSSKGDPIDEVWTMREKLGM